MKNLNNRCLEIEKLWKHTIYSQFHVEQSTFANLARKPSLERWQAPLMDPASIAPRH